MNAGHGITGSKNVYSSKVHIGNWRQDVIGQELVQDLLKSTAEDQNMSRSWDEYNATRGTRSAATRNRRNTYSTTSQEIGSRLSPEENMESSINFPNQSDLKSKNKNGLSYLLLFSHTNNGKDISHSNRYTSHNRLSSSHHLFRSKREGGNENNDLNIDLPETNRRFMSPVGMRDTYTKRVLSNNDWVFPPVESSQMTNRNKVIRNALDLDSKITTTARLANKHFPNYSGDRTSSPYTAIGRSEFLPSARR